jgi:hypothetical protein
MILPPASLGAQSTQRRSAAAKQAFNPQISQVTQIIKIINKNNDISIGFHDLPGKNLRICMLVVPGAFILFLCRETTAKKKIPVDSRKI